MTNGDEYFAELDYIESVEKYKEDFEADVMEDEEEDDEEEEEEEENIRAKTPEEEETEMDSQVKSIIPNKKRFNYSEDNDFMPAHAVRRDGDSGIRLVIARSKFRSSFLPVLTFFNRTRLRSRYTEEDTKDAKTESKSETKEKKEITDFKPEVKVKKEIVDIKAALENLPESIETVTISDEEDGMFLNAL